MKNYSITKNYIEYTAYPYKTNPYSIPVEELKTIEGLNDWVKHLSETKIWFNLNDFNFAVKEYQNKYGTI